MRYQKGWYLGIEQIEIITDDLRRHHVCQNYSLSNSMVLLYHIRQDLSSPEKNFFGEKFSGKQTL